MVQCFYCSSCGQWGRRFKHGCRKCKIGQFKHSKCGRWVTSQFGFCPICYKDRLQRILTESVPKKGRVKDTGYVFTNKPTIPKGWENRQVVEENFSQCVLKKYNLKINYPSTWIKKNSKNRETKVFFQSQPEDPTDQVLESVFVGVDDTIGNITLDAFIQNSITDIRQSNPGFNLIDSSSTTLSGIAAHQIIYLTSQLKYLVVTTVKDNIAYWVMYVAEPVKYNKFLPLAEQMISSFEFLA